MNTAPDVIISEPDFEKLTALLAKSDNRDYNLLFNELDRADIVSLKELPEDVVRMYSTVTFSLGSISKKFTTKLVYPHETEGSNAISILSPVGSALLGLSVGECIEWPLNNGVTRVRIEKVENL